MAVDLRHGIISLRRYRLHHISSSCTQTFPGIRRVNLGIASWYPNSLTLGLPLWKTEVQRRTSNFLIWRWAPGNAQNKTNNVRKTNVFKKFVANGSVFHDRVIRTMQKHGQWTKVIDSMST